MLNLFTTASNGLADSLHLVHAQVVLLVQRYRDTIPAGVNNCVYGSMNWAALDSCAATHTSSS